MVRSSGSVSTEKGEIDEVLAGEVVINVIVDVMLHLWSRRIKSK